MIYKATDTYRENSAVDIVIPADFKENTLVRIRDFNNHNHNDIISEVYGSLPDSGFAAGRSASSLPQVTREQFESYVHAARDYGVIFNYTLNGSCLGAKEYDPSWREEFYSFINYLSVLGISAFTVSTPSIVAILRHQQPFATITVSVTADVTTRGTAIDYASLGANKVMASISLYRRFKQLKHLAITPGIEVGILLNSFCFPDCTYRSEHFNTSSHLANNEPSLYGRVGSFDFNRCDLKRLSDPKQFLGAAWVRPEDVVYYENIGVSFFKLEGRQLQEFDAVRVAMIYCQRHYDGNLCNLHTLFSNAKLPFLLHIDNQKLNNFIDKFLSSYPCSDGCNGCGHCDAYIHNAIRVLDQNALNKSIRCIRDELANFIKLKEI